PAHPGALPARARLGGIRPRFRRTRREDGDHAWGVTRCRVTEGCHGLAGEARGLGVWGPYRGPQLNQCPRYSRTERIAMAPSATAAATPRGELWRTSPAAKTPGRLVSST